MPLAIETSPECEKLYTPALKGRRECSYFLILWGTRGSLLSREAAREYSPGRKPWV
jgi:hypothetical protein